MLSKVLVMYKEPGVNIPDTVIERAHGIVVTYAENKIKKVA